MASGANDNKVMIWNLHKNVTEAVYSAHKAAVKALAWNPHQKSMVIYYI